MKKPSIFSTILNRGGVILMKELDCKEQQARTQFLFWGEQRNLLGTTDGARNIFAIMSATSRKICGIFAKPTL